jgi:hypothetical protein
MLNNLREVKGTGVKSCRAEVLIMQQCG